MNTSILEKFNQLNIDNKKIIMAELERMSNNLCTHEGKSEMGKRRSASAQKTNKKARKSTEPFSTVYLRGTENQLFRAYGKLDRAADRNANSSVVSTAQDFLQNGNLVYRYTYSNGTHEMYDSEGRRVKGYKIINENGDLEVVYLKENGEEYKKIYKGAGTYQGYKRFVYTVFFWLRWRWINQRMDESVALKTKAVLEWPVGLLYGKEALNSHSKRYEKTDNRKQAVE